MLCTSHTHSFSHAPTQHPPGWCSRPCGGSPSVSRATTFSARSSSPSGSCSHLCPVSAASPWWSLFARTSPSLEPLFTHCAYTDCPALISYVGVVVDASHQDCKPELLLCYNGNKGGVNKLNNLLTADSWMMRRWTAALFHNLLNVSVYNAFVHWQQTHLERLPRSVPRGPRWDPGLPKVGATEQTEQPKTCLHFLFLNEV